MKVSVTIECDSLEELAAFLESKGGSAPERKKKPKKVVVEIDEDDEDDDDDEEEAPKPVKKKKVKKKKKAKKVEEDEDDDEDEDEGPSLKVVEKAVKKAAQASTPKEVKAIFKIFKAKKLSEIKSKDYAALIEALEDM